MTNDINEDAEDLRIATERMNDGQHPVRVDCHVHLNIADCMNCQHEFVIAHEPGQLWYKCPSCHTEKSTLRYEFIKPDPTLECTCGNKLFRITQKGVYCPNCGKDM